MPLRVTFIAVLALAAPGVISGQGRPRATVTPAVESSTVVASAATRIALHVELPPGLHVQSDQPRDPSLIPTALSIEPAAGVRVDGVVYPDPLDFRLEGQDEPLAVFDHEFVTGALLAIDAGAPVGDLMVHGRLRYQACNDRVCFAPATAPVTWTLHVVPAGTAVAPGSTATRPGTAAMAAVDAVFRRLDDGRVTSAPADPSSAATEVAPGASADSTGAAPRGASASPAGAAALARFAVRGTTGGYLNRDDFLSFVQDAELGRASAGLFDGQGPVAIVLLVLLGGLALNLTPCVLPMIPINLAIIGAGAQAGSRRRGLLLGAAYGGAMALVYGVLGLIVVLTASTFGAINASPWFNAAIAVIFVVLALGMFDVIPIDFSRWSSGALTTGGRGSFALAFTMGAVAALLAGACVAPVVIQVIIFASDLHAGGSTVALALPFFLGLGMALPWPLAGAGVAALPRPGAWMVRVKQGMGLIILASALYYGHLSYTLFDARSVEAGAVAGSVQEKLAAGWTDSLDAGLALAERDGRPVLLDFWATWCKNCLTMDRTTFEDGAVTAALDRYVKIKVQAEDPDAEPARAMMARFNAIGLPTYVILEPSSPASRLERP